MPRHGKRRATSIAIVSVACVLLCAIVMASAFTLMTHDALSGSGTASASAPVLGSPSPSIPISGTPGPSPAPGRPTYQCPGFSGIETRVSVEMLLRDTFVWGEDPPYQVGNGSGDIRWTSNPYDKPSWYMWLHSLRWLGQGIQAAGDGDRRALTHVMTIIHDWVRDHPYSWKTDVGAWESTMHRTNVLLCARQAVMSGLRAHRLPAQYAWLDQALLDHTKFMTENWSGPSNHGTDESIAMFGVGCILGRTDVKNLAVKRLNEAITIAIDPQGSTNEQSVGYAMFNYQLWGRAATALERCDVKPGPTIEIRRRALAEWIALATNSIGELHQVGDTIRQKPQAVAGTPLEYAATLGKSGERPTRRTAIFDAGYVFGRTGWGESRPFTQESTYSIRFGPARQFHGHDDHTSITYTSRGRDILIDAGHSGYQLDKWQAYVRSQSAHNVMTIPTAETARVDTQLAQALLGTDSEYYRFSDKPAKGVDRTRDVLVLKDPDLIVTLDRGQSAKEERYETLWHLPPDQKVTVQSATTAIAAKPGDRTKTYLLQIPYQKPPASTSVNVRKGQSDPVQGWYFPHIFHRDPAPVVTFGQNGRTASILSVVAPVGSTETVAFSTRSEGPAFFIDLTIGAQKTTVRVLPDGRLTRTR
ncbi:heparinase II/III domain-containing protein [Kribbella swartbergensis]